ncbi:MAG: VCBS repeat-containing protein [Candidatus Eisenbacteria bacterium]|nr:VCBS repeat-containing protein [Candidatus Eisenbacteria bacterium]
MTSPAIPGLLLLNKGTPARAAHRCAPALLLLFLLPSLAFAFSPEPDFEAPGYFPTGDYPHFVEQADFNGDGLIDLVVSNRIDDNLVLFLGNGSGDSPDGTFTLLLTLSASDQPYLCTVADLNGDDILDLVVGIRYLNGVDLFLGGGSEGVWDSTFSAPSHFFSGHGAYSAAVGDFNEDGIVDLAVANDCIASDIGDSVSVLIGTGADSVWDGGFESPVGYPTDHTPQMILAHDFNEDGILDLVTCNAHGASVSVLIGDGGGGVGDGTFHPRVDYSVGSGPHSAVVEDFNEDGIADLAVSCWDVDRVSVLLGNGAGGVGDGTFSAATHYAVGDAPRRVVIADCDGDSIHDLVTCDYYGRTLSVLTGYGDGTFASARTSFAGGTCWSLVAGRFDEDGFVDVVAVSPNDEGATFYAGKGDGTFRSVECLIVPDRCRAVVTGDWNGDGHADLAAAGRNEFREGTIFVFTADEAGHGFTHAQTCSTGTDPADMITEDFNGDSIPDLASLNRGDGTLSILLGAGGGAFGSPLFTSVGNEPAALVTGDFDDNGVRDLILTRRLNGTMSVLLGVGDGTFAAPVAYAVGWGPRGAALGDFNGDEIEDVAIALLYDNAVSVLLGNGAGGIGDGTFAAATPFAVGENPHDVITADWNGDEIPDLAVTETGADSVVVLLGNGAAGVGDGTFSTAGRYAVGLSPIEILTADWNGDGILDLATADSLSGTLSILTGNGGADAGDGTFDGPYVFAAEEWVSDLVDGDFDGIGGRDIIAAGAGFYVKNPDCRINIIRNRLEITALPGGSPPPALPRLRVRVRPNPFNPVAAIRYELARRSAVRATVHEPSGRLVSVLFEGVVEGGEHTLPWNGRDGDGRSVASGVYLIRVETDHSVGAAKAVLLR